MTGYRGRWAWVDLTNRTIRVAPADPGYCRDYVGGRGLQARLLADHLEKTGPLKDPLGPQNRVIIGNAALNDTAGPPARFASKPWTALFVSSTPRMTSSRRPRDAASPVALPRSPTPSPPGSRAAPRYPSGRAAGTS